MFRENLSAEISQHRQTALVSERIPADVVAVRREHAESDVAISEQTFARCDDIGLRSLRITVQNIQESYCVFLQTEGNRNLRKLNVPVRALS